MVEYIRHTLDTNIRSNHYPIKRYELTVSSIVKHQNNRWCDFWRSWAESFFSLKWLDLRNELKYIYDRDQQEILFCQRIRLLWTLSLSINSVEFKCQEFKRIFHGSIEKQYFWNEKQIVQLKQWKLSWAVYLQWKIAKQRSALYE